MEAQDLRVVKDRIDSFCLNTINAVELLYKKKLYAHMMVLIYSAVDSMGLLVAEPNVNRADSKSFQNWTQKYLIEKKSFNFRAIDFWAARCGVLHTFTTESDLSRNEKANEIQYYSGNQDSETSKKFERTTQVLNNGKYVPANIENLLIGFLDGLKELTSR